ncbi:hypothetical protein [Nocardia thraciensis]
MGRADQGGARRLSDAAGALHGLGLGDAADVAATLRRLAPTYEQLATRLARHTSG